MNSDNHDLFNRLDGTQSVKANIVHETLRGLGTDFAAGVPCGVLKHLIQNFEVDEKIDHFIATRESEAVGLVAGAYFAGKTPVLYMQNSGLFAASNDIASLLIPYAIPLLILVTYRGCEGEDAIQHSVTGSATESLLSSFGIHFSIYNDQDAHTLVTSLVMQARNKNTPAALLMKRGWHRR